MSYREPDEKLPEVPRASVWGNVKSDVTSGNEDLPVISGGHSRNREPLTRHDTLFFETAYLPDTPHDSPQGVSHLAFVAKRFKEQRNGDSKLMTGM
eukprot:scaffold34501_cov38-Tisochrysis_lutea.AAC.2